MHTRGNWNWNQLNNFSICANSKRVKSYISHRMCTAFNPKRIRNGPYICPTIKRNLKGLILSDASPTLMQISQSKTLVDIGLGRLFTIVCGASNVESGKRVVVAPVGSTIYQGWKKNRFFCFKPGFFSLTCMRIYEWKFTCSRTINN